MAPGGRGGLSASGGRAGRGRAGRVSECGGERGGSGRRQEECCRFGCRMPHGCAAPTECAPSRSAALRRPTAARVPRPTGAEAAAAHAKTAKATAEAAARPISDLVWGGRGWSAGGRGPADAEGRRKGGDVLAGERARGAPLPVSALPWELTVPEVCWHDEGGKSGPLW
jgi:hypothetical protein